MANVTIYTTMMCPYCYRAKDLLGQKGVSYDEIDVGMDADLRKEMMKRAGALIPCRKSLLETFMLVAVMSFTRGRQMAPLMPPLPAEGGTRP